MLIRTEAPADLLAIDALLKAVFPTDAEANLVMALRENGRLTLSLVACSEEGEVIGHAMFSPVTLNGEDFSWQGLAPLAVKAQYQNQGRVGARGFDLLGGIRLSSLLCIGQSGLLSPFRFYCCE